jgi:hypothetical protein
VANRHCRYNIMELVQQRESRRATGLARARCALAKLPKDFDHIIGVQPGRARLRSTRSLQLSQSG